MLKIFFTSPDFYVGGYNAFQKWALAQNSSFGAKYW